MNCSGRVTHFKLRCTLRPMKDIGKNAGEQSCKSSAIRGGRHIGLLQNGRNHLTVWASKQSYRLQNKPIDLRAQKNASHGNIRIHRLWQFKAMQFPFMEPSGMTHLVNVVIFGGHPENGNSIDAFFAQLPSRVNRRQCLVESVSGATK